MYGQAIVISRSTEEDDKLRFTGEVGDQVITAFLLRSIQNCNDGQQFSCARFAVSDNIDGMPIVLVPQSERTEPKLII
jgi:hypothetical protein